MDNHTTEKRTPESIFFELDAIEAKDVRTKSDDRRWFFLIGYVKGRGWWQELTAWQNEHGQQKLSIV